jgi:integrase
MAITERKCQTFKCTLPKGYQDIFDAKGLSLRCYSFTGKKTWVLQYTFNKKRNSITFGSYPNDFSLAEARIQRDKYLIGIKQGKDPKIVKNTEADAKVDASLDTIGTMYKAVMNERINSKTNTWSKGHIKRTQFTWNHLKPIAKTPITQLKKKRLRELLVSINQGVGASTGDKCKALMSSIYTYAVLNDLVSKNLVSDFAKDPELKKRGHDDIEQHPPIPFDRLGEIYTLINNSGMDNVTKYALFCLQYTALRVGSLLASRWEDYDPTKKVLRIHKEFVKNKKAINCPVIKQMADMFDVLKKAQQLTNNKWDKKCFIFSTDGIEALGLESPNMAVKRLLLKHQVGFRAVPHGFRNTCETHWVKSKLMQTAINVQQDHKSTTGDLVRDRYISQDEDFFKERTELLESMAKLIKDAMSDYESLQRTINNAKGSSPIMATSDTIDAT